MSAEPLQLVLPASEVERLVDLIAERAVEVVEANLEIRERRTWLTVAEAAERLGVTSNAVLKRIRNGRLEVRRQGTRIYVSARSIEELA